MRQINKTMTTHKPQSKASRFSAAIKALSDPTRDHSHCWTQKNPPCGQKIEHYKCCLCEKLNPKIEQYGSQREAEGREKALRNVPVGFVRQWINEDLLKDGHDLITNEDIQCFIDIALTTNDDV
jgi:hypothetical protein